MNRIRGYCLFDHTGRLSSAYVLSYDLLAYWAVSAYSETVTLDTRIDLFADFLPRDATQNAALP